MIERLNREIKYRTCVVDMFPNGKSALMLVIVGFKCVSASKRGSGRYSDVPLLKRGEITLEAVCGSVTQSVQDPDSIQCLFTLALLKA